MVILFLVVVVVLKCLGVFFKMASVCVAYCTEPIVGVGRNFLGSAVLNPQKTQ